MMYDYEVGSRRNEGHPFMGTRVEYNSIIFTEF
jgi:hypothetical protein